MLPASITCWPPVLPVSSTPSVLVVARDGSPAGQNCCRMVRRGHAMLPTMAVPEIKRSGWTMNRPGDFDSSPISSLSDRTRVFNNLESPFDTTFTMSPSRTSVPALHDTWLTLTHWYSHKLKQTNHSIVCSGGCFTRILRPLGQLLKPHWGKPSSSKMDWVKFLSWSMRSASTI